MITCSSCGVGDQPDHAKFCFACGSPIQAARCCGCQAEVARGARFCSECGAPQAGPGSAVPAAGSAPAASRRVTSVLFGDLVGFTGLSETRDSEEVRELLSAYFEECRQIIARYGGTVEKFIGDAVMAVWGVPTSHEDDAERAVRAGLELVNRIEALGGDVGVPRLAMRVGIVTGEVAVTVGATQQGMVAGDAVNTAARVQSAAVPGQVWVDETTRLLTTAAISYVDVGSHPMKGKADPVPLWSVRAVIAAVGGAQRADGLEAPHVGRDRELRLLKELFHGVEESGRPALAIVAGEAGVGKSRLGWEFEKYVDGLSTSIRWHSSRCLSYGEGVAYYALAEAVRGRLQAAGGEGAAVEDDPVRLLAAGMDAYVPDPDERAWLEPRLGALLGIGAVGSYTREDLFAAWVGFLRRVGDGGRPVVLMVDDAQHADDGLVGFFEYLLSVATFPVFVLLLARPGLLEEFPALATTRRVSVVHLETLSEADMSRVLDGLVANLPTGVRNALVERAEGIPLYAVETVRSLIDRDLVLPRGGQYVLADARSLDLDALAAPASLQALIAARLDTLPAQQRRVLDQASVLGQSFSREALAVLCPEVTDLDDTLVALVRAQLLRQESGRLSAERGQFQFVQSAVRQVAYAMLSRRERKASHLAVIAFLESREESAGELAAILARHHLEAIDAAPDAEDAAELTERAVELLQAAAARASGLGAPAESAVHLEAALTRCVDPVLCAELQTDLADELARAGQHEPAIEHATAARDAYDALGNPVRAGRAVALLAQSLVLGRSELEAAETLARERLELIEGQAGAAPVELKLMGTVVGARVRSGADFEEEAMREVRLADRVGETADIAGSYVSLALHFIIRGPHALGRVLLEHAAGLARETRNTRLLVRVLTNLNAVLTQEDAARAAEFGREAYAVAAELGDRSWHSNSAINLVMTQFVCGDWDPALEILADGVLEPVEREFGEMVRAAVLTARGERWEQSAEVDLDQGSQDTGLVAVKTLALAIARQTEGRHAEAASLAVSACRTSFDGSGIFDDFTMLWAVAADVVHRVGDRAALDELFAIVDQDTESRRPTGLRAAQRRMQGLRAIEDGEDPQVVEEHLRAAIAESIAWHSEVWAARSRADLGTWLRDQGRTAEAEGLLAAARATYQALGASVWLAELDGASAGRAG